MYAPNYLNDINPNCFFFSLNNTDKKLQLIHLEVLYKYNS